MYLNKYDDFTVSVKENRRWLLFMAFFLPSMLFCQKESKEYNFVSIKEGITKVAVSTIIQDHYGFIWMGTNGAGLCRFDGIDYTYYKHQINDTTSLSSNLIFCTLLDSRNRLWTGTEDGLNLYDRDLDRFKRIRYSPEVKKGTMNIPVISLSEDNEGNIFVGTFEKGHLILPLGDKVIQRVPSQISKNKDVVNVNSIKIDGDGKIYSGSNLGLEEYNSEEGSFGRSYFNTEDGLSPFEVPIQSILMGKENSIWIGTLNDGLYKILIGDTDNGVHDKIFHYELTDKRILSMIQLLDGTIMIGTENDGMLHIASNGDLLKRYEHDKADPKSIRSNSIWSLFIDGNNRIWMGYYNSGVGVYDSQYDKFSQLESLSHDANNLETGSVTGIIQDGDGKIWISMDGGGIDIYDPSTTKIEHLGTANSHYSGLSGLDIQTIFRDSKENIWAGSWNNGLFLLKKGSNRFVNYNSKNLPNIIRSNRIISFAEDSEGILWIGSFYDGLLSYDPYAEKFTRHTSKPFISHELHTSAIRKVLVDSKNNIWLGTTKGLFKVKKLGSNTFSVESMAHKIIGTNQNKASANHILSLYEGSDGKLWIGTRGSGLCSFEEDKDKYVFYNESNGLKGETVASIVESSNGDIWISSNSGIFKLDPGNQDIINYTSSDGLLSNDFNFNAVLEDNHGKLYFGNYKGIDYFDPAQISKNSILPSLYLTDFKLFNQDVVPNQTDSPIKKVIAETDSITLNHKQSVFTIEYASINYTRSEKNQYAYYLEGLEDSWNYVEGRRNATYTNLDQGDYSFKLKAANNDGVWNETPLELKITVLPPWWKTNMALMGYLFLFLLGIYLLNKITKERLKQKQLIRNERDQRLREEELHEQKLQFFTNISHEFRTPLTLIINPIKDIIANKSLQLPENIREKHNIIFRNTDRLYRLINELMDFRKLEHNKMTIRVKELNLPDLVDEVVSYFKDEALNKNMHLTVEYDLPNIPIWADDRMLEKIVFNILSNAMKVTSEGGAINIDVNSTDVVEKFPLVNDVEPIEAIEIIISDTGPGLTKEQVIKIFERFYQVRNLNKGYYGSTGIGLEVVQNFVKMHKGKVEVTSKVGEGTSFRIVFPKGKEHFERGELLSDETGYINEAPKIFSPREVLDVAVEINEVDTDKRKLPTLLIVEDNTELRNYLGTELKDTYKVLMAKDGKEGLKIAKDSLPDVILTDVIMPEMDGFIFCKFIKQDIRTSHIPLMMLTAKAKVDDRIEGIELGADAYMVKPFDMRLLRIRLEQLITSRKIIFDKYFSKISGSDENTNTTSLDKNFIQKVLDYIHENLNDTDLSVESLSSELNLSRSQMYRKVKSLTGQTVNEFLRNVRLQYAKQLLESEADINISEVCYRVGFSSPSYFTKCFKSHFGVLPTEVVKN